MTDLQDALDRWASDRSEHVINRIRSDSDDVTLFVDAARRVANPDYEAMLRILWEHFYDDMEGNPSDPDEAWEYNKEWSKIQMVGLPERLWAAALGISEDTE